jgi:multidrug efflux pump subunit AcrA (membrane-fusion protein)
MKRNINVLLLLAIFISVFSGCAGKAADSQAPELLEPVGVDIDTAKAYIGTIYNIKTYEGLVLPEVKELSFTSDGLIGELNVYMGCEVKKGDVLAQLDVSYYEDQLEALQSSIDYSIASNDLTRLQAQCDIDIAKAELEKLKAENAADKEILYKQIQIESLQNKFDADGKLFEISLEDSYRQFEDTKEKIESSRIISPADGRVVYYAAAEGGYAIAHNTVIWVADNNDIHICCPHISTEDIEAADEVYATVAGERVDIEYEPYDRATYLSLVAAGKEPDSKFRISDSRGLNVESGMFAVVYVISDYTENALILPAGAVQRDSSGESFVYKLEGGEKVRQVIKKGVVTPALVQITEGLTEGDEVCVGN